MANTVPDEPRNDNYAMHMAEENNTCRYVSTVTLNSYNLVHGHQEGLMIWLGTNDSLLEFRDEIFAQC